MDIVAKVIPLKFVTSCPKNVALNIELCFGFRYTDGEWYPKSQTTKYPNEEYSEERSEGPESYMPEHHRFFDCALLPDEELPKLVQLINCVFSSPLRNSYLGMGRLLERPDADLCRIYLDFNLPSSFYQGNSKLAEQLADKLKGLRKFMLWANNEYGSRVFIITGLNSEAAEEFCESSNLPKWSKKEAFAEVSRIKALGDEYASKGNNFAAQAQYIIAGLMLGCRAFPRLRKPRPLRVPRIYQEFAAAYIPIWLSAARVSELQEFASCPRCVDRPDYFAECCPCKDCEESREIRLESKPKVWNLRPRGRFGLGTLEPQSYIHLELVPDYHNPHPEHCDKKCEARHLRKLARRILRNCIQFMFMGLYHDGRGCRTDQHAEDLVVPYCKDYMEHGDWKEARSQLHWALHKIPDSQVLQDLLDEVNSQMPKSNRRTRWRASKEQIKQAVGPQSPKERTLTVERPPIEEFFQLSLFDQ